VALGACVEVPAGAPGANSTQAACEAECAPWFACTPGSGGGGGGACQPVPAHSPGAQPTKGACAAACLLCDVSGAWVGSSVVHLGDHNVPNAFVFLDKYTQVSRILGPIVLVIESIPRMLRDHPALGEYVRAEFGTAENLVTAILSDFFRHGFDGGGADNFFDAGSVRQEACARAPPPDANIFSLVPKTSQPPLDSQCIDGRLTSAGEWCAKIDRKAYAPVFRLIGVMGFDGRWEGK
jgi:hypothetical protein